MLNARESPLSLFHSRLPSSFVCGMSERESFLFISCGLAAGLFPWFMAQSYLSMCIIFFLVFMISQ